MKPPCNECAERHTGCHSSCEKYREWKTGHEAKKEIIFQKKCEAKDYYDYKVKQIIKSKKRR